MTPADNSTSDIRIVDFAAEHAEAFRTLNEQWITRYFALEDADRRMLGDPEGQILRAGGAILVALRGDEPVGVCALVPHDKGCLELAKMAVAPSAQGLGIGGKLARAALDRARALGACRVYLESNTTLAPALALYRKLGFSEIPGDAPSPYRRADIRMELDLGTER